MEFIKMLEQISDFNCALAVAVDGDRSFLKHLDISTRNIASYDGSFTKDPEVSVTIVIHRKNSEVEEHTYKLPDGELNIEKFQQEIKESDDNTLISAVNSLVEIAKTRRKGQDYFYHYIELILRLVVNESLKRGLLNHAIAS